MESNTKIVTQKYKTDQSINQSIRINQSIIYSLTLQPMAGTTENFTFSFHVVATLALVFSIIFAFVSIFTLCF